MKEREKTIERIFKQVQKKVKNQMDNGCDCRQAVVDSVNKITRVTSSDLPAFGQEISSYFRRATSLRV